jgi:hypothetical protein
LGGVMAKHVLPNKAIETTPVRENSGQLRVEENLRNKV